jgi:hypothetical protein
MPPAQYGTAPSDSAVRRFLRRPPGVVLAVGALSAAGAVCWSNSSFGTAFGIGLLGLGVGTVVCMCWLIRAVASAVTSRRFFLRTLVVPVIVGVALLAVTLDVPTRVRFAQAEPGFERAVAAIAAGADPADFAGRIGTYRVDLVVRQDSDVYFYFPGGFLGSGGVAHLPDGPSEPASKGEGRFSTTPFSGPWYRFTTSWD